VFLASDSKNGGVTGVYRGFEEAAARLGWRAIFLDGRGLKARQAELLSQAIKSHPDGIVFGGVDATDFKTQVDDAKQHKIVMVGWHAARNPGPSRELFVNVATSTEAVAKLAVNFIIRNAKEQKRSIGVVIFTDNRFSVARAKTIAMVKEIEKNKRTINCRVLSVENIPITEAGHLIPEIVPKLMKQYGYSWTYCMAINDVYFDNMNFPLVFANRTDIINVSAGDGSSMALSRIRSGLSQQAATVAEPLRMQGFQLADELNRAFAGTAPSGYMSKPILVTATVLKAIGEGGIDSNLGFEATYSRIWAGN